MDWNIEMSNYFPDNWVVIKFDGDDPHYRVLAGWSGSYAQGDSWQLNSGIVRVKETDDAFHFFGSSGSCYSCRKSSYRLGLNNAYVWGRLKEKFGDRVSIMDEDTDWNNMDWIIS